MLQETDVEEVLSMFPPVTAAFAYGSGAVEQGGYQYSDKKGGAELPMLDLVFVVEDSVQWHEENMRYNPGHYTPIIPMTPSSIAYAQEKWGARMWYNAMVPMNTKRFPNRHMKYGVVSTNDLIEDCRRWSNLYASGRLHKPVHIMKMNSNVYNAIQENKKNALYATLLLLPKVFSEYELFLGIASLSYIGDPRMLYGENPKKVINLVSPIVHIYRESYKAIINDLQYQRNNSSDTVLSSFRLLNYVENDSKNTLYTQDVSKESRWELAEQLPWHLKRLLLVNTRKRFSKRFPSAAKKPPSSGAIRTALASIVTRSAGPQSFKGLLTVGIVKCSQYLLAKIGKRFPNIPLFGSARQVSTMMSRGSVSSIVSR